MKVLICGDRNWKRVDIILRELLARHLQYGVTLVIQGGNGYVKGGRACRTEADLARAVRGADALGYQAARRIGLKVETVWADWNSLGNAAGMIRNSLMLQMEPDLVLAFHGRIEASKGTADTLRKAERLGIPHEVISG